MPPVVFGGVPGRRDGTLSLDQAPVGGSYSRADPLGLFQFIAPDDPRPLGFAAPLSGTYVVRLEVEDAVVAEDGGEPGGDGFPSGGGGETRL